MSAESAPATNSVEAVKRRLIRPILLVGVVFSPVVNLLVLTSSLYMMQVFDRVMTSQSIDTLVFLTIIALAATALMAALELVRSRVMTRLGLWLEMRLATEGIGRAVEATLLGRDYRSEVLRDIATIRNFFTNPSTLNLFDVPWVPVYLVVVAMLSWKLGMLALAGAVLLGGLAWLNDRVTAGAVKDAGQKAQRSFKQAESAIRNAEVLDVMGMTPGLVRRWRADSDSAHVTSLLAADRSGDVMAFSKFVRLGLQLLVMGVGAYLALSRELTSGGMITCSIIISRALAPIESAIGSWKYTISAWQAYGRIRDTYARPLLRASSMTLPKPKGHLTVENVSYAPPGWKVMVIKGVTFEIKPGQVAAIVGPSAAGKSTLARLIPYQPAYVETHDHLPPP
jgi:ABC-type protease/lipase transport system fused ATPase/permease subunit